MFFGSLKAKLFSLQKKSNKTLFNECSILYKLNVQFINTSSLIVRKQISARLFNKT